MEDHYLISRIAEGDEKAFKELYNRHREKLYRYLLQVTKSQEIAEEILIDIFLKIWTGREMLREVEHFQAYLGRVAANKAIDFFRFTARNRKTQEMIRKHLNAKLSKEQEGLSPLHDLESADLLHKAMDELSPQRRLIFSMSRDKGMSNDEISKTLNLSSQTVRNTVSDSLKAIRRYIKQQGFMLGLLWGSFFIYFFSGH